MPEAGGAAYPVDVADFWARWLAFVRGWRDADDARRGALLDLVLAEGLDAGLAACGADPADDGANALVDPADAMTCAHDLVAAAHVFDDFGYMWHNHELHYSFCGHHEGLRHYVRHGWRQLRNPSLEFDVWWYWYTYLDPTDDVVDPLLHYLAEGRLRGLSPVPPVQPVRQPPPAPGPGRVRRACLFAGFDGDGLVDDYVVDYVRELSRHADVYYLTDCPLEEGELDKLAPYTRGRWTRRHGMYDFGSYSVLARDLVGWDTLATYDEVLLANDSCYLLRPLDEVFATMDARPAHWWGLQATHDSFTPGEEKHLGRRLRVPDLVREAREQRPWRLGATFHVGSYFLALRRDVISDPGFRRRLDTVARQADKNSIIRKYEIGISAYLTLAGYHVETFIEGVLPFHPIYRETAFEVMEEGFPFIKRQFLHENPFHVPDLDQWQGRVLAIHPGADVEAMERNLWRVSPVYNLRRAMDIHTLPNGSVQMPELVEPHNFEEHERFAPRFEHWWAFPVDSTTHRLEGNARAVFEAVRWDPTIKKVLVVLPDSPLLGGLNVAVAPMSTQESTWYLLRCGFVFVSRGPRADVAHPLAGKHPRFVDLRRGTPLASYGATTPVGPDGDRTRYHEALHDLDLTRFACASSEAQARAMKPAISSPHRPKVWVTGSPRTDLLVGPEESLPTDLRAQLVTLRRATRGRPLVVWAPAWRGEGRPLPELDLPWVRDWAERHDAVVGVRPPARGPGRDRDGLDRAALRDAGLLVLSPRVLPDVEVVLREAAALVSDYTDELLDYLVLERPAVAWVPDLDAYRAEPGLLHDLDDLVPGRVCRGHGALADAWEGLLDEPSADDAASRADVRARLHAHHDGRCALRVARRVRRTYLPEEWFAGD